MYVSTEKTPDRIHSNGHICLSRPLRSTSLFQLSLPFSSSLLQPRRTGGAKTLLLRRGLGIVEAMKQQHNISLRLLSALWIQLRHPPNMRQIFPISLHIGLAYLAPAAGTATTTARAPRPARLELEEPERGVQRPSQH